MINLGPIGFSGGQLDSFVLGQTHSGGQYTFCSWGNLTWPLVACEMEAVPIGAF